MHSLFEGLYPISYEDVPKAATVLTQAFFEDPGIAFSFPDPNSRAKKLTIMWSMTIRDRIRYGEAYATSPAFEGVALWLPPNIGEMGVRRVFQALPIKKMGTLLSAAIHGSQVGIAMEKAHYEVMQVPHYYLSTLGVDPVHQGKGLASKLIRPMLTRCNQEGIAIYLETATEKDVQLYLHYGFEVKKEFRIGRSDFFMKSMVYSPRK
jgi:ribosomal protein S18 acetylase RimI-like enzyme